MPDQPVHESAGVVSPHAATWLRAATAVLVVLAVGFLAYGIQHAWLRDGDIDTFAREDEYVLFRQGVYPNGHLEEPPATSGRLYSVYPPYAFPMFAFFFEPGGLLQARILIQLLSLASLVVMGLFAWRVLAPYGEPVAMLGAVAGAAMAGNGTALMVGQFSIICMGLIVLQIVCLQRRRPVLAGICWALAMIKPQIALPFGLLFLFPGQAIGALVGTAILAALTLLACFWTELPLQKVVGYWSWGMSLKFTEHKGALNPGGLAAALGVDSRGTQRVVAVALTLIAVPLVWFMRRLGQQALVPVAGFCAVAGMFFAYHRYYDNVMLFPALVALIALTAASRRPALAVLTAVMIGRLLLPQRVVDYVPLHGLLQAAIWTAAGILPLRLASTAVPRQETLSGEAGQMAASTVSSQPANRA